MVLKNSLNEYSLVFCLFHKPIMKLGTNGFFRQIGKQRGVLVKRVHCGEIWYHRPEDYLKWKEHLGE